MKDMTSEDKYKMVLISIQRYTTLQVNIDYNPRTLIDMMNLIRREVKAAFDIEHIDHQ